MVVKSDWKTIDMPAKTDHFLLEMHLTKEEMAALQEGFLPREMEDKWFMYYEDHKLYIHRSWTGFCVYIVTFMPEQDRLRIIVNRDQTQYTQTDSGKDQLNLTILINRLIGRSDQNAKLMKQYLKEKE